MNDDDDDVDDEILFYIYCQISRPVIGSLHTHTFWFYSPQKLSQNSIAQLLTDEINFQNRESDGKYLLLRK